MSELAQTPIIDAETLETLRQAQIPGEPDFIAELVEALEIEAPDLLARMQVALGSLDAPRMRLAAHSLKSAAGNLGARRLRDVCEALELMASSGDVTGADPLVARAKHEYDQALVALNQVILAAG